MNGRRVIPGSYQVRLTVGEFESTRSFEVVDDPRLDRSSADFAAVEDYMAEIQRNVTEIHEGVIRVRDVREQIKAFTKRIEERPEAEEVGEAADSLVARLTELEEMLVQPRQETFQDVVNFPSRLNAEFLYLASLVDAAAPPITEGQQQRLADLSAQWAEQKAVMERLLQDELDRWNALVREKGIPAVIVSTEP